MSSQLSEYIKQSREKGVSDESIRQSLLSAGWQESDIQEAFLALRTSLERQQFPREIPRESSYLKFFRRFLIILYSLIWIISFVLLNLSSAIGVFVNENFGVYSKDFFNLLFVIPFQLKYLPWLSIVVVFLGVALFILKALSVYKDWHQRKLTSKVLSGTFLIILAVSILPFVAIFNRQINRKAEQVVKNIIASPEKNISDIESIRQLVDFPAFYPKPEFSDSVLGSIIEITGKYSTTTFQLNLMVAFSKNEETLIISERNAREQNKLILQADDSREWREVVIDNERIRYFEELFGASEFSEQSVFLIKNGIEIVVSRIAEDKIPEESLFNFVKNLITRLSVFTSTSQKNCYFKEFRILVGQPLFLEHLSIFRI